MEKKVELNNLNEEITLTEEELKHVNGGAAYLKLGDIDGESFKLNKITPAKIDKSSPILMNRGL